LASAQISQIDNNGNQANNANGSPSMNVQTQAHAQDWDRRSGSPYKADRIGR
jgi:hypothetical protein